VTVTANGKILVRGWLVAVFLITASVSTCRLEAQQAGIPDLVLHYADIVLYNGRVYTANKNFTVAEALAIRDSKFLAVGTTAQVLPLAGPKTRKVDLKGKAVTPGIMQLHTDASSGAMREYWARVFIPGEPEWKTVDEFLAGIKRAVARARPGQVVYIPRDGPDVGEFVAGQSNYGLCRGVTLAQLDSVSPNTPVFFVRAPNIGPSGLNSKAAELVKPFLPKGVSSPFLYEGYPCVHPGGTGGGVIPPATAVVRDFVFFAEPDSLDQQIIALKLSRERRNAVGQTLAGEHTAPPMLTAINEIWRRGEQTLRIRFTFPLTAPMGSGIELMLPNPEEAETVFRRIGNMSGVGDDMLRFMGVRSPPVGGQVDRFDAWTLEPKIHHFVNDRGEEDPYGTSYEKEWGEVFRGRSAVVQAIRYGWDVNGTHAVGDRSVREIVNAYEEGLKTRVVKRPSQRLSFDHNPFVHPDDIQRIAKMGVMVSIGPNHIFGAIDAGVAQYGTERLNTTMPVKSYIKAGMHPVLEGSAWSGFYNFVTRKDEKYKRIWNAKEMVTRQEALWMMTLWAAEQLGEDDRLGSIEVGKLADLAVLDRDPVTVPEDAIPETKSLLTIVGGKVVYEREGTLQ
jgi:hypothetical protein